MRLIYKQEGYKQMKKILSLFLSLILLLPCQHAKAVVGGNNGNLSVLNSTVEFRVSDCGVSTFQLTGTWTATITFEGTTKGDTWVPIPSINPTTGATSTTQSSNGIYIIPCAGFQKIRANVTAYTSGTITANALCNAGSAVGIIPVTFSGNTSTNIAQVNGNTVDTGTGTGGMGTQRIAVDSASSLTCNAGTNLNTSALATEATLSILNGKVTTVDTTMVSITNTPTVNAAQSGTWTLQPGNTPNTTPWLVTAGHGKTIKTVSGSLIADTDVIAAVASKRIKVIAYSFITTNNTGATLLLKSNGTAGAEQWRIFVKGPDANTPFGANLAVPAPSFLFATVAGEKLTVDTDTAATIHYSVSYFDDDAS